jgi:hypothetical protein
VSDRVRYRYRAHYGEKRPGVDTGTKLMIVSFIHTAIEWLSRLRAIDILSISFKQCCLANDINNCYFPGYTDHLCECLVDDQINFILSYGPD